MMETKDQNYVQPEILFTSDLCRLLGVSRSTLHRMNQANELPRAASLGGRNAWRRKQIDSWLDERFAG